MLLNEVTVSPTQFAAAPQLEPVAFPPSHIEGQALPEEGRTETLSKRSVSNVVLLPDDNTKPTVMSVAMVIVVVAIADHDVPLVELCIAKLLPVRVTRIQQLGGVCEFDVLLLMEPPEEVRRIARILFEPEPRRSTLANREPLFVVSRIIKPVKELVDVPLWLVTRVVIEPSPLSV